MAAEYIESELYGGDVQIRFYPGSHQYWASVDGDKMKRKKGVTGAIGIKDKSVPLGIWQQQITADFLLSLIEKGVPITYDLALEAVIQNDVLREGAADIGKEIHGWCEAYIRHKLKEPGYKDLPPIPDFPEAVTGVNSFLEFVEKHNVEFRSTERVVFSKKYDYIGTMDFEAVIDGKLCMGDFKSSNGLYNGVRMQTAAYAMADMEENKKKKYEGRWAIRLSKFTEAEYIKKEKRKKEIKEAIARVAGKDYKEYPIKPYQVFEAKFLDNEKGWMKRDFEQFLNCQSLCEWDALTDPFKVGENW